jgi:hypothetical protein
MFTSDEKCGYNKNVINYLLQPNKKYHEALHNKGLQFYQALPFFIFALW